MKKRQVRRDDVIWNPKTNQWDAADEEEEVGLLKMNSLPLLDGSIQKGAQNLQKGLNY